MNLSLNNLLVENLKTGKVGTIKTLLEMGTGPFVTLDYVENTTDVIRQQQPHVASQTIWFWIHQAPRPDAVEFCWSNRLERELSGMSRNAKAALLTQAMEDAAQAALSSQNAEGWLASWERVQAHVSPFDPDALVDRQGLLAIVKRSALQYGDASASWLLAMNQAGHLVRLDVQRWFSDGESLGEVLNKAYPDLLQVLLDIGDRPTDLAQWTEKAEGLLVSGLDQPFFWESDEHFGPRQLKCLKVLKSHWEQPLDYRPSDSLRQAVIGLDSSSVGAAGLSQLKDFLLEATLETPVSPRPRRASRL
jgi:hypothetical protein